MDPLTQLHDWLDPDKHPNQTPEALQEAVAKIKPGDFVVIRAEHGTPAIWAGHVGGGDHGDLGAGPWLMRHAGSLVGVNVLAILHHEPAPAPLPDGLSIDGKTLTWDGVAYVRKDAQPADSWASYYGRDLTAADLDALPVWSVVEDCAEDVWVKEPDEVAARRPSLLGHCRRPLPPGAAAVRGRWGVMGDVEAQPEHTHQWVRRQKLQAELDAVADRLAAAHQERIDAEAKYAALRAAVEALADRWNNYGMTAPADGYASHWFGCEVSLRELLDPEAQA